MVLNNMIYIWNARFYSFKNLVDYHILFLAAQRIVVSIIRPFFRSKIILYLLVYFEHCHNNDLILKQFEEGD